jgi:hypothetical protein
MFYRRKIVLALLQLFDGELEKIKLQKLLFLFVQKQDKSTYDFIPYKYGCYSYSANADFGAMVKKNLLIDDGISFVKTDEVNYLNMLKANDLLLLQETKKLYGRMNNSALVKHTYINFPYWTTKSEIAEKVLTKKEFDRVKKSFPKNDKSILFTIGYEGISLEEYLNRLLKNDIKVLIDVRQNPISMKYGFSKTLLKRYCESLGIKYMHFPDVGIQGSKRQELNTQSDYNRLFNVYKRESLPKTKMTQKRIVELLTSNKRIALTCFEANIHQCHRKPLAESIESLEEFVYEVKHI